MIYGCNKDVIIYTTLIKPQWFTIGILPCDLIAIETFSPEHVSWKLQSSPAILPAIFGWNKGYHGWKNEWFSTSQKAMVHGYGSTSKGIMVQTTMWISLEATREARQCQGSRRWRNLSLLRPRLSSASFIRFIYRKVLPANRRIRPTLCLEGQDGGPCGLVRNEILELFIIR